MNSPRPIRRWSCPRSLSLLGLLSLAGHLLAATGETNSPVRFDYGSFRIIPERNIFNPRRSGGSDRLSGERRREATVERFALVGTMNYAKGPFAFFDSNSPEYRKVLRPEDTIAGYKITEINGQSVKLEAGTNTVELGIGMQMRREEQGSWHAAALAESFATPADDLRGDRSRGGVDSISSAGSPASGGESSDALKRLMEKRAQETK